jgi:hypothetical protein
MMKSSCRFIRADSEQRAQEVEDHEEGADKELVTEEVVDDGFLCMVEVSIETLCMIVAVDEEDVDVVMVVVDDAVGTSDDICR